MSDFQINQIVSQMRELAAQAKSHDTPNSKSEGVEFASLLKTSIDKVNDMQLNAGELTHAFEQGDKNVDLPQVMIALQKAGLSFEAMRQVRNKLVSAYEDIKNMPV